jgi:hypothetical protein
VKRLLVAAFATLVLIAAPAAFAWGGETTWSGNGSENLPCTEGGHWVLSPGHGLTAATLTVNGVVYPMTQSGEGSWSADSVGPLDAETTASATWVGEVENGHEPFLKLSHCTEENTTGGTGGTTGETTGTTGTTGTTTGTTGTTGETTGTTGTTGETGGTGTTGTTGQSTGGTGAAGGGTTGGAASPGGELPFTGLPVGIPLGIAALLLFAGILTLMRWGRREG